MRDALLIYNPAAGQWWRRPSPERIRDRLAEHGYACRVLLTRGQDHATALVRDHLDADTRVVWACGGDGTLGQVATGMVDSGIPIGIVPIGTVNVVASECGIPANPRKSIDALSRGAGRRTMRVWKVNGRAVILGMGAGFEARVIGRVPERLKDWLGPLAVGAQGLVEAGRYRFPPLLVSGEDADGRAFECSSTQLLVTNTKRFAGRQVVVPDADPSDGHLDVLTFTSRSRLRLAAFWLGVEIPAQLQLKVSGVRRIRARRLSVRSLDGEPVRVHVNGDAVEQTPVEVQPWGEVQLLVPEASGAAPDGPSA